MNHHNICLMSIGLQTHSLDMCVLFYLTSRTFPSCWRLRLPKFRMSSGCLYSWTKPIRIWHYQWNHWNLDLHSNWSIKKNTYLDHQTELIVDIDTHIHKWDHQTIINHIRYIFILVFPKLLISGVSKTSSIWSNRVGTCRWWPMSASWIAQAEQLDVTAGCFFLVYSWWIPSGKLT
jgi:hypothetical protein